MSKRVQGMMFRAGLLAMALAFAPGALLAEAPQSLVSKCQDIANPEAARAACRTAIESGEWAGAEAAWAWNNLGLAEAARGAYLEAIAAYDTALELDPAYVAALSNRGNAHAELGDMLAALTDHEAALAIAPKDVAALHNRAVDLEELGRHRDALTAYEAVLAVDPDHAGARIGRATANCKLGRSQSSAKARLAAIETGALDATEMQVLLQTEGFYRGAIDGIFGKGSRAALRAWTRAGCLPAA